MEYKRLNVAAKLKYMNEVTIGYILEDSKYMCTLSDHNSSGQLYSGFIIQGGEKVAIKLPDLMLFTCRFLLQFLFILSLYGLKGCRFGTTFAI
ncbi:uncharacterized protein [Rutidosis leptorrhynchoides]|uniref:uncharacterized protein isoform X2 n=1 Tax=Rutidosis leptorrhynchoides TaxID=125765 RepID=UPI003A99F9F3